MTAFPCSEFLFIWKGKQACIFFLLFLILFIIIIILLLYTMPDKIAALDSLPRMKGRAAGQTNGLALVITQTHVFGFPTTRRWRGSLAASPVTATLPVAR